MMLACNGFNSRTYLSAEAIVVSLFNPPASISEMILSEGGTGSEEGVVDGSRSTCDDDGGGG